MRTQRSCWPSGVLGGIFQEASSARTPGPSMQPASVESCRGWSRHPHAHGGYRRFICEVQIIPRQIKQQVAARPDAQFPRILRPHRPRLSRTEWVWSGACQRGGCGHVEDYRWECCPARMVYSAGGSSCRTFFCRDQGTNRATRAFASLQKVITSCTSGAARISGGRSCRRGQERAIVLFTEGQLKHLPQCIDGSPRHPGPPQAHGIQLIDGIGRHRQEERREVYIQPGKVGDHGEPPNAAELVDRKMRPKIARSPIWAWPARVAPLTIVTSLVTRALCPTCEFAMKKLRCPIIVFVFNPVPR